MICLFDFERCSIEYWVSFFLFTLYNYDYYDCRNGIGRSGVFCSLWNVMEKIKMDDKVDIFQAAKRLRASRPNMVESLVSLPTNSTSLFSTVENQYNKVLGTGKCCLLY